MKYKALIVDVDGTLVPSRRDGMPSEKVSAAVSKASKLLHVGVATSRPYFLLSNIFSHLRLSGPSIINGGSQIVDIESKKVLWEQVIQKEDLAKIARLLTKLKIKFFFHAEDKDIKATQKIPDRVLNVVIFGLVPKKAEQVTSSLSHLSTIAIHKTVSWELGKNDLIISHVYATKQHGILEIAKILNIDTHEIIGVGDGYNDFPLLMACGLKIAMGNAVEDLKAIADYVAPPVEEDGLAHVIEKFVL